MVLILNSPCNKTYKNVFNLLQEDENAILNTTVGYLAAATSTPSTFTKLADET